LAAALAGCATNAKLGAARSGAGVSPYSFWPPPPSTALWIGKSNSGIASRSLAAAANDLARQLRYAGYAQQRWFPIGVGFAHGFAVTTRLERIEGANFVRSQRWSSLHSEPPGLRWLLEARSIPLNRAGTYRTFLFALTDLPMGPTMTAPVWNAATVMGGPGIPEVTSEANVPEPAGPSSARLGVYVYLYEKPAGEKYGHFVLANEKRSTEVALLYSLTGTAGWQSAIQD
jgi:hypothetical protein